MLTNKSNNAASFPNAYAKSKNPLSLWWLRFSMALGYRDIAWLPTPDTITPLQKRACEFGGIKIERLYEYPAADIYQLYKCLADYLQFPNVRLGRELRSFLRDCCYAWDKGGSDAFCERWNEGGYLLPGQEPGQTIEEFLNLPKQEELL